MKLVCYISWKMRDGKTIPEVFIVGQTKLYWLDMHHLVDLVFPDTNWCVFTSLFGTTPHTPIYQICSIDPHTYWTSPSSLLVKLCNLQKQGFIVPFIYSFIFTALDWLLKFVYICVCVWLVHHQTNPPSQLLHYQTCLKGKSKVGSTFYGCTWLQCSSL